MKPEAQWYLVEALANARSQPELHHDYEAKQQQLSHFAGVLAGFRYLGALSQEEEHDWFRKMLVALGYQAPDPAPPGVGQAIYLGDLAKRPPRIERRRVPVFIRSQPGPDGEFEVHGGSFRVISVEFYDSIVAVRWRVAPPPEVASVFPDEIAALEQDLSGLEDWAAENLRRKGHGELFGMRLYQFGLTDDVSTSYVQAGSRHGGGAGEMNGEAHFTAPPSNASMLFFSWLGLEVPIPIH